MLARINRGDARPARRSVSQARFCVRVALDPTAADRSERDRLGARSPPAPTVQTQPLYDAAEVEESAGRGAAALRPRGFPVPLLLGVLPLAFARHAEFLHNEVPGITVPDGVRARMHAAGGAGCAPGSRWRTRCSRPSGRGVRRT